MPDASGFPYPHEIADGIGPAADPMVAVRQSLEKARGPMSEDQWKAVVMVTSGRPFVAVAMQETSRPGETEKTGCDFLTAIGGDKDVLRNVKPFLPDVIERLYHRKGVL